MSEGKVKFIRKNGRLIPINGDKKNSKGVDAKKVASAGKKLQKHGQEQINYANKKSLPASAITVAGGVAGFAISGGFGGLGRLVGGIGGLMVGRSVANGLYGNVEKIKEDGLVKKEFGKRLQKLAKLKAGKKSSV
jgi:hypothetical protein